MLTSAIYGETQALLLDDSPQDMFLSQEPTTSRATLEEQRIVLSPMPEEDLDDLSLDGFEGEERMERHQEPQARIEKRMESVSSSWQDYLTLEEYRSGYEEDVAETASDSEVQKERNSEVNQVFKT